MNPTFQTPPFFTLGYSGWPPAGRMTEVLAALTTAGVKTVVDARLSPCSPSLAGIYGPRPWNLQPAESEQPRGLVAELAGTGLGYEWIPELGNPQKNDPQMRVFREHLQAPEVRWPAQRGLLRLLDVAFGHRAPVCLLCTCRVYERCHLSLILAALERQLGAKLSVTRLSPPDRRPRRVRPVT